MFFLKSEKKRKIRILEHCSQVSQTWCQRFFRCLFPLIPSYVPKYLPTSFDLLFIINFHESNKDRTKWFNVLYTIQFHPSTTWTQIHIPDTYTAVVVKPIIA